MNRNLPLFIFIGISLPLASIAFDYEQVRRILIPLGQDPAAFHYDKMMEAATDGKARLARAHARARIPYMSLTYRSINFSKYVNTRLSIIAEAITAPDKPLELKLEALPLQLDLDTHLNNTIDFTEEIERIIEKISKTLKELETP